MSILAGEELGHCFTLCRPSHQSMGSGSPHQVVPSLAVALAHSGELVPQQR